MCYIIHLYIASSTRACFTIAQVMSSYIDDDVDVDVDVDDVDDVDASKDGDADYMYDDDDVINLCCITYYLYSLA